MNGILAATLMVGGTGLLIGILLGIAGKKFYVEVDERETKVREALPGNNCGGCGYPGCDGAAAAVVKGEAPISVCPVGGAPVAAAIGAIMGQEAGAQERRKAVVRCAGTCDVAKNKYEYTGARDCSYAVFVPGGGPKSCGNGCLGFGNCVKACKFDAIHIENGIAVVDGEGQAHELGRDRGATGPGLDGSLLAGGLSLFHLLEKVGVDEGAFLERARHVR